jgi:hypothetical protein
MLQGSFDGALISRCYLANGKNVANYIHLAQRSSFPAAEKKPQVSGPTIGIPNMLKFMTPAIEFFIASQVPWLSPSQC